MMAARSLLALALVGLVAAKPMMHETFGSGWESRWQHSEDDKYSGKFEVEAPTDFADEGLKVPEKAKHYGISALLDSPVDPASGLALQYEVKLTEGLSCGGAYLKFVTAEKTFTPAGLKDDTPYTVMFGPDKCGATNKVHLIFRHKNPKTGTIEEKHLKSPPTVPTDDKTHVYTAIIKPDNTFSVMVDGVEKSSGSLLEDFTPSFVPPTEIADPEDSKPEDWVDTAKIPDPEAVKPEDWDEDAPREIPDEDVEKPEDWLDEEPLQVADPSAEKPEDWDEEEDGEWEAPQVPNPKCAGVSGCGEWKRPTKPNPAFKGKWSAPLIDNPEYKGTWKPRDIPNPEYHDDTEPLKHIGQVGAVAAEIWTMDSGIFFDNIVVASDGESVVAVREAYWKPKHDKEVEAAKKKEEEAKAKDVSDPAAKGPDPAVEALKAAIDGVPFLASHKATLAPLVAAVEATPAILYAAVIVPAVLLLVLILRAVAKPSSAAAPRDAAAAAKKTDAASVDDAAPAVANGAARAAAAATAASTEIEEDEDEGGAVRRRTRRDT